MLSFSVHCFLNLYTYRKNFVRYINIYSEFSLIYQSSTHRIFFITVPGRIDVPFAQADPIFPTDASAGCTFYLQLSGESKIIETQIT